MRLVILLIWLCAGAAQAGPWMREPGTGFYALSGTVNDRLDTGGSAYLEYGLRDRLTLGAELDLSMPSASHMSGAGRVFAQFPLQSGTAWVSTWSIGLGGREIGGQIAPFASAGFALGRGLSWRQGGWFTVEGRLDLGETDISQFKLDTTLGLQLAERGKGMVQLFLTAKSDGDIAATLAPSYIFTPRADGPSWQVGLEAKHTKKKTELGLKLGLWRNF